MEHVHGSAEVEQGARYKQLAELLDGSDINEGELFALAPMLERLKAYHSYHPAHSDSVYEHSLKVAAAVDDPLVKIAALYHDAGKMVEDEKEPNNDPEPKEGQEYVHKHPNHHKHSYQLLAQDARALGLSGEHADLIGRMIYVHDFWDGLGDDGAAMIRNAFSDDEDLKRLFELQIADLEAHDSNYANQKRSKLLASQEKIRNAKLIGQPTPPAS